MRLQKQSRCDAAAGFSMIELLIVVAIIMVISGMAAPSIMTSVRYVRLRGATSSMTNLFEQARMMAVRNNRGYMVLPVVNGGTTYWYIDLNNNQVRDAGEPQATLPQSVSIAAAPPSNASLSLPAGTNYYPLATQTGPAFNTRGLPCYALANGCLNYDPANNRYENFAYYVQDNGFAGTLYMAVTIAPNGKIKTWRWSGTTWTK
jgi:prepilin-type N-terminal cleavage/methylation domain-containing protein